MLELSGKKLLVLGGSRSSCEIVEKAKSMGVTVTVTDWYDEKKSPAKRIADKSYNISTTDIPSLLKIIRDDKIDGILTGYTDSTLPHYARLCEKANLPSYGTVEQFEVLINKKLYKKKLKEFGVPVIDEYTLSELENMSTTNGIYPLLIKPADNSGAKGISICRNHQELNAAYNKALSYSQSNEVLIERYIEGDEITAFYALIDGKPSLLAVANRHMQTIQSETIPLPVAYTIPSDYTKTFEIAAHEGIKKFFSSMDLENGMVFLQCLVKENNIMVYDMGYRLTGSMEYKLLDKLKGINTLEMLIKFSLTGEMTTRKVDSSPYFNNRIACNFTFSIKPGRIKEIEGLELITNYPGVIDAKLKHVAGDTVSPDSVGTLNQIIMRVFGVFDTQEEMDLCLEFCKRNFNVKSVNNEDMLLDMSSLGVREGENL